MLEFKPLNNVFPTYHNMIIQNILCSILTPYPFIHPSLQVLHKWIHRWNQYWGFLGGTGKTETNRIKLSKGYFYHKAQNSWEDKKKKNNQNMQHISAFLSQQENKKSPRTEAAAGGHAVLSHDSSSRHSHPSTSLQLFSGLLAQHCLSDMLGQPRRWQKSGTSSPQWQRKYFQWILLP